MTPLTALAIPAAALVVIALGAACRWISTRYRVHAIRRSARQGCPVSREVLRIANL